MITRLSVVVLVASMLLPCCRADDPPANALAKARVDAAKETYQGMVKHRQFDPNGPSFESIYTWSHRWMEGEQALATNQTGKLAALQSHFDRMKEWESVISEFSKKGLAPAYEVSQGRYNRLEAESWLADANKK